jgi:hypothetical protein
VTIRPGEPWGTEIARPGDLVEVDTDHALAARGSALTGVRGGDLFQSLGAPPSRDPVQQLPVDGLRVRLDGEVRDAVAHVVLRRGWWRGRLVAVMNVDRLGDWNVAPRAHPNDGRFDVVEVDPAMTLRDRWAARGRLPAGTHVPHPRISVSRGTSQRWTFDRPIGVWLDGVSAGRHRVVEVEIVPDRYLVVV